MEPLSLLFSVVALAVAGITVIAMISTKAKQQKQVHEALKKNQGHVAEMDDHLRFSREHMKSAEAKLDRIIELLEQINSQS